MVKYKVILDDIISKVEDNSYRPGVMLPTEHELTELYSASRTTIQRALNILVEKGVIYRVAGKGTFISDTPLSGKSIFRSNNNAFSLLLPNHSQECILYARGAQACLEGSNYRLNTHFIDEHYDDVISEIDELFKEGCPGIILYPGASDKHRDYFRQSAMSETPIITIDKDITGAQLSCVLSHNYMGAYSAASHFIEKGHKNFLFLSHDLKLANSLMDRFSGFSDCLCDNDIVLDKANVMTNIPSSDQCTYEMIYQHLSDIRHSIPLAVFCSCDRIAPKVYRAAYDLNIKIPEDMSVIGFDNLEISELLNPTLTTVAQPFYDIGYNAAELLVKSHEKRENTLHKIMLPVRLVVRSSVADITAKKLK